MRSVFAIIALCLLSASALAAEDNIEQAKATIARLCGEGKPGDPVRCAKWQSSLDAAIKQKSEDVQKRARGCTFKYDKPLPDNGEWICP